MFPGTKIGKPISQNTMIYACYRMGYRGRQTVHGFRGMASTWGNEQEVYNSDWIEMALAHAEDNDIRGAYNSALYLTPRRRMLQDWADVVTSASEQVNSVRLMVPQSKIAADQSNVIVFPTSKSAERYEVINDQL